MYDIVKYLRTMIRDASGHLIQSYTNIMRKRQYLNFSEDFIVTDNSNNNSTDVSLSIKDSEEYEYTLFFYIGTEYMDYISQDTTITKIKRNNISGIGVTIDTLQYKVNNGVYQNITFTNDEWNGSIAFSAGSIITWEIEYASGKETGLLYIKGN